jgi:hypothetical protein
VQHLGFEHFRLFARGSNRDQRERRSTQRLFEELRVDARFDSRTLVHRQPISPFGDGEFPEVIIEIIASRFLHADLGKVLFFRDVCIADDDHQAAAQWTGQARKYFEMIGHGAQKLKAHSIGGGESRW